MGNGIQNYSPFFTKMVENKISQESKNKKIYLTT